MINKPLFTIVIPTLNEEKYLPLLLEDLIKQTNTNFKVIHVDANSEDNTILEAKKFTTNLDIKTITTQKRNVSHQRNLGIKNADTDWIIFMDADNRLPTYFLDGIKYRLAKNPETDIFTTWLHITGDQTLNQPIEKTLNFALEIYKIMEKESAFGSMIGVKTNVAKKHLFDEKQQVMEDSIFVKNIVEQKHTFTIFKDPTYTYSLRRIETKGFLKSLQKSTRMVFNYYIKGNDFKTSNFGYEMNGGSDYNKSETKLFRVLIDIEKLLKSQTKTQIEKTKQLFKSILRTS